MLAYAGLARGHVYVHEAIADPTLRRLTWQLMAEAGATLPAEVQGQVPAYADALVTRFENPELAHRLEQMSWVLLLWVLPSWGLELLEQLAQELPEQLLLEQGLLDHPLLALEILLIVWVPSYREIL